MERNLYSERQGRARDLQIADLASLVWKVILDCWDDGFWGKAFYSHHPEPGISLVEPTVGDPGVYFLRRLKQDGIWERLDEKPPFRSVPASCTVYADVLFDLIELLHDHASLPMAPEKDEYGNETGLMMGPFEPESARARFRSSVNEELALWSPPLELRPNGHIVERTPDEFRPLVVHEVPDDTDPDVRDPLRAAIDQFTHRGATAEDKRAAVVQLVGIVERHRDDVIRGNLLSGDESDLFQIANRFALRHRGRDQKTNYDPAWLDWMFYVYLATARAIMRVLGRDHEPTK